MKKTFLILILFLIGISFFEAKAVDCPTGFDGPYTITIPICADCSWVVEWCCSNSLNPANIGEIYIKSVYLHNSNPNQPCSCVETIETINGTRPVIPWNSIYKGILEFGLGCYSLPPNIPPCDWETTTFIQISNGGCYEYFNDLTGNGWRICGEIPQLAYCYTQYKICYELIGGQWRLKIEPYGSPIPDFQCENGCERICQ